MPALGTRGPQVEAFSISVASAEIDADTGTIAAVQGLERWLRARGLAPLGCATLASDALAQRLEFCHRGGGLTLVELLQALYLLPWRAPGRLQVTIQVAGEEQARVLQGLKALVDASRRVRIGQMPWWCEDRRRRPRRPLGRACPFHPR